MIIRFTTIFYNGTQFHLRIMFIIIRTHLLSLPNQPLQVVVAAMMMMMMTMVVVVVVVVTINVQ